MIYFMVLQTRYQALPDKLPYVYPLLKGISYLSLHLAIFIALPDTLLSKLPYIFSKISTCFYHSLHVTTC